jgi:hypothetical protein
MVAIVGEVAASGVGDEQLKSCLSIGYRVLDRGTYNRIYRYLNLGSVKDSGSAACVLMTPKKELLPQKSRFLG